MGSAGAASARRGLGIRIAWAKHARELAATQENHACGQPSALIDPAADFEWIHRIQRLRRLGIGYLAPSGIGIPGGMKSEPGTGGHAYPVMRNRTENDGAGRNTRTVDDYPLTRAAHALIFTDIGFDPAAGVLRNSNRRAACSNPREHE